MTPPPSKRSRKDSSSSEDEEGKKDSNGPMKCDHNVSPLPVPAKETKFYRDTYKDTNDAVAEKLACTACPRKLTASVSKLGDSVMPHPVLGVMLCKECYTFYGDGNFDKDEDGYDSYCRWCAQGGALYCCSKCSCAFCKKCIRRNFDRSVLKEVEEGSEWMCFACKPKQLWPLRAHCWAIFEVVRKEKRQTEERRASAAVSEKSSKRRSSSKKNEQNEGMPDWLGNCITDAVDIAKIMKMCAEKIKSKHDANSGFQGVARTVGRLKQLTKLMMKNLTSLEENMEMNFEEEQKTSKRKRKREDTKKEDQSDSEEGEKEEGESNKDKDLEETKDEEDDSQIKKEASEKTKNKSEGDEKSADRDPDSIGEKSKDAVKQEKDTNDNNATPLAEEGDKADTKSSESPKGDKTTGTVSSMKEAVEKILNEGEENKLADSNSVSNSPTPVQEKATPSDSGDADKKTSEPGDDEVKNNEIGNEQTESKSPESAENDKETGDAEMETETEKDGAETEMDNAETESVEKEEEMENKRVVDGKETKSTSESDASQPANGVVGK